MEAPGRSWPKFRADHPDNPQRIRNLVATATAAAPMAARINLVLAAHSGGMGSFIIGYLNSGRDRSLYHPHHFPRRQLFLLRRTPPRRQIPHLASQLSRESLNRLRLRRPQHYPQRGKKSSQTPAVHNWRASHRMIDRFTQEQKPQTDQAGPFLHYSFLSGQAQFFLHPNPQQKILHTTMIGEMNAFLHATTLGTPVDGKYGTLGGPPAYTSYIANSAAESRDVTTVLNLPPRPATAPTGSAFLKMIASLPTDQREQLVTSQILAGNIPIFTHL